MIEVFHYYNDLCIQIDILKLQIKDLETERDSWWIGGKLHNKVSLSNAAERVDRLSEQIEQHYRLLDAKKRLRNQIEVKLAELNGLEYKVAYKRFVEGKTLAEIAEDLHHSEIWIKRVSARVTKKLEEKEYTDSILTD